MHWVIHTFDIHAKSRANSMQFLPNSRFYKFLAVYGQGNDIVSLPLQVPWPCVAVLCVFNLV